VAGVFATATIAQIGLVCCTAFQSRTWRRNIMFATVVSSGLCLGLSVLSVKGGNRAFCVSTTDMVAVWIWLACWHGVAVLCCARLVCCVTDRAVAFLHFLLIACQTVWFTASFAVQDNVSILTGFTLASQGLGVFALLGWRYFSRGLPPIIPQATATTRPRSPTPTPPTPPAQIRNQWLQVPSPQRSRRSSSWGHTTDPSESTSSPIEQHSPESHNAWPLDSSTVSSLATSPELTSRVPPDG
jgi:hypothetical protein